MKQNFTKQLLLAACLLAGMSCTEETDRGLQGNPPTPTDSDSTRREVVMTFKNELALAGTKAIATAAENKITALDVYVFGSDTEDGTYTFQERFAYRETPDVDPMPAGATNLTLTTGGDDDNQVSTLMALQKGLFVKIYCVANQTVLLDTEGNAVAEGSYTKLILAHPGVQGTGIGAAGVPKELDFLAYHSPLLNPAVPTDVLGTPLPMTGAVTTPIDLTDFSAATRLQVGFKLTRTVARFDVVNKAAESKLTISKISMGNGRKGTTLFPIAALGDGSDLIAYPPRDFTALEHANTGITPGAFYIYPSPTDDNGYIILEGTYRINDTETKAVSYRVPFKSVDSGSFLEINPNHRYTLAITAADEYRIDFNITVADWADNGSIEGYQPEEPPVVAITVAGATETDGNILRLESDGGTLNFDIADYRENQVVPFTVETSYEPTYGGDNWLSANTVTTKSGATCTVQVATNDNSDTEAKKQEVHIGYITVKWGARGEDQKKFTVYRGASCVTYLDKNTAQTVRYAAVKMKDDRYWAPINVGAVNAKNKGATTGDITDDAGKFYQWGRIYGFRASSNSDDYTAASDNPVVTNGGLPDMEKWNGKVIKPLTSPDTYGDWLIHKEGQNNPRPEDIIGDAWYMQLWNAKAGIEGEDAVKTQYDPCPEGWRVPTMEEWKAIGVEKELLEAGMSWDVSNMRFSIQGKENSQNLILPIAGYTACMYDGISPLMGSAVCYWSSSCNKNPNTGLYSTSALMVYSYTEGADKLKTLITGRADLAPVRCIHE